MLVMENMAPRLSMPRRMGSKPQNELFSSLQSLHTSQEYADLVLCSRGGGRFPVHRAIICPRSQKFADEVRHEQWKDEVHGDILVDLNEEILKLLIDYLYLLDYDPISTPDEVVSPVESLDSPSSRTEAMQYGTIYGTSAVSAFGGPSNMNNPTNNPNGALCVMPYSYPRLIEDESLKPSHLRSKQNHGGSGFAPHLPQSNQNQRVSGFTPHLTQSNQSQSIFDFTPHLSQSPQEVSPVVPASSPLATRDPNLILHAKVYVAAAQYSIDGLKSLASEKFKIQLTRHWDSPEFAQAIHEVYTTTKSTDGEMRDAIVDMLTWRPQLLDKPEIEATVCQINGLAYELLKRSRRPEPEHMR